MQLVLKISGNHQRAELVISNLDEQSEGEYIISGTLVSSKPYTRPLNLLLLRPPSPMNLEELQIEVEEGFSQVKIAKCYALDAKPPAKIKWVTNDPTLQAEINNWEGTEQSIVSITPNRRYNGMSISCQVEHETISSNQPQWQRSLELDVRYKPGAPIIEINDPVCGGESESSYELKCDESEPSNPP